MKEIWIGRAREQVLHLDKLFRVRGTGALTRKPCLRCSGSRRVKGGKCPMCFGEGFERK